MDFHASGLYEIMNLLYGKSGLQAPHNYSRHKCIMDHSGEKLSQCDFCEKEFTNDDELNIYKLMHTRKSLFQCTQCVKSFSRFHDLESHMMKHN